MSAEDGTARFLVHAVLARDPLAGPWLLAADAGLRRGELHGLKWEDVDLDRGTVSIRRLRVQRAGGVTEVELDGGVRVVGQGACSVLRSLGQGEFGGHMTRTHPYGPETWHPREVDGYVVRDRRTGLPYRWMSTYARDRAEAIEWSGAERVESHEAGVGAKVYELLVEAEKRLPGAWPEGGCPGEAHPWGAPGSHSEAESGTVGSI